MKKFDVFICHNKNDVSEAKWLNEELKKHGLCTWFDEEQIRPGRFWQREIEKNIANIKSSVVCMGASGIGPWHDVEMQTLLQSMVKNNIPLIPVIMRNVPRHMRAPADIPAFLTNIHMVDTRKEKDPIKKIIWGING